MGYLREFVEHVSDSFQTLFSLEADPALDEHENVERVIGHTATVASICYLIQPFPLADVLVLTPIQAKMAVHIGRLKGFDVTQERAHEIVVEIVGVLGMTLTAQLMITSVVKVLPVVGGLMASPMVYAATWAIGNVVDYYFDCLRREQAPSSQAMKDLFVEQFRVGKAKGEQLDRTELQRKADELRRRMAERDPSFQTETRLPPRDEAPARAARAAAGPAAAAPAGPAEAEGGRKKIKITLGPRADGPAEPAAPARKTIGPLGHVGPEAVPAPAAPSPPAAQAPTPAPPTPDPTPTAAPAPAPASAPTAAGTLVDQLERLAALRAQGVLTDDELAQAKRRLLGL